MNDFKEESIELININLKIHNANVLLRSIPPEPDKALKELVLAHRDLANLIENLVKKGVISNEFVSSLRDNETKTNDIKRP